jgi:hypothetical protein
MNGAQQRIQRLTREAIGGPDTTPPEGEQVLRAVAFAGWLVFVFALAACYPA